MIPLNDSASIITSRSRGIGAATALMPAEAGSDIVINYVEDGARAAAVVAGVKKAGRRIVKFQGMSARAPLRENFCTKQWLNSAKSTSWSTMPVPVLLEKLWQPQNKSGTRLSTLI